MSDTTEIVFSADGMWKLRDIAAPHTERDKGDLIPDLAQELNAGRGMSANVQWLDAINITDRAGNLVWRLENSRRATGTPGWIWT